MKLLVFTLALLASQALGFSRSTLDLGLPASGTPYDSYMTPVKAVLTHLSNQEASMDQVRHLMHEGREFRYSFTSPYVAATPEETATTRAGDCKAKALWLADQLNDDNVRFVIGKARSSSHMSHAWLMWQHQNRWYILDCTNNWEPIAADHVASWEYIPYYSFAKTGEYRHHATQIMMATTTVASTQNMIAANH